VKPPPFAYHRPRGLEEALDVLASLRDEAKVLAGGQSLVPLMSMRLSAPAHLVDVNHVPGLDSIEVDDEVVRVGATARHSQVEHHAAAYDALPLLRRALRQVAHPTIRNRGTTVGSLVHADPAAEMPAVLCLLDGTVTLRDAEGSRDVAAADFFLGPMESAVRPGELAVAASFPRPPPGTGSAFVEVSRRQGDYAMCGVGALVRPDGTARVALISVGPGPVVVELARPDDAGTVRDAVDASIDPEDDIHASADYRRHLAHVLVARALTEALTEARGEVA
jgi:carbon-monoxide dehydrogenase medium subunit